MPLKRISDQKSQTIQEFYIDATERQKASTWEDGGKAMLGLIEKLDELFPKDIIWCLTSLYRLVLLTDDSWKSPWYVTISCLHSKEYYIEYLMPNEIRPWENATVKGTANSLDMATKFVLIAMKNSRGWQNLNSIENVIKI